MYNNIMENSSINTSKIRKLFDSLDREKTNLLTPKDIRIGFL